MSLPLVCALAVVVTVLVAMRRSRQFAAFALVLVGLQALVTAALAEALPVPLAVAYWMQVAVAAHISSLTLPRLRSLPYRLLVSGPALWWTAGAVLGIPWAVAVAFGASLPWPWLPWVVAGLGVVESLWTPRRTVEIHLDGADAGPLAPFGSSGRRATRPLRLVQISDPHLGPFMSVERLRRIAQRAVADDPDLVLLTGDFLTMESMGTPGALAAALEPLRALPGRAFACRGNHDLEAPEMVARELAQVGVRLLVDEAVEVPTPAGPVQILGIDFRWRSRQSHHPEVAARWPRVPGHLRLVLLHDPGAIHALPEGEGDLVLSGHTHGGQVGLVSLGMQWTFVRQFARMPDHSLWARGRDRLYVHRGTGHYGFPLRVGVPAEEGLILVHTANKT